MSYSVKIGDIFGQLTVVEDAGNIIEPSGHKRHCVKVRCSCNKEWITRDQYLKRGLKSCKRCSHLNQRKCSIGDRFDKLIVLGYEKKKNRKLVICKCDCGNVKKIRPECLYTNQTNSCGCKPNGLWKGVGEISGIKLYRIKENAITRNLEFSISPEYLWNLYIEQNRLCALSGIEIEFSRGEKDLDKSTASLDRISSSAGYVEGNVQWVHKDVNRMKWSFDQDHFIELCKKVAENND